MTQTNRRTFLRATGAAAVGVGLAGCSGGGSEGDDGMETTEATETAAETEAQTETDSADYVAEEPDYEGYLDDANGYDRTVDATGSEAVTVTVGAGEGFAFGPAAVKVSSGTTVTWEWAGEGGDHNVVAEDESFESSLQSEEGATFEYTFEESGIHTYYCSPHKTAGMKAAVVVE